MKEILFYKIQLGKSTIDDFIDSLSSKEAKKSAISRIENHAKDIKLSTLENFAHSIGKELKVSIA